jgi:hypothetical protein
VIALTRYQTANLFRSHRWIFPLILYTLLISVGGGGSGGQSGPAAAAARAHALAYGLDWSAALLVPVVALLTRSMLTAEPAAARACVSAARGPARAQLATLVTAFAGGVVLGLAGAIYELVTMGRGTALLAPLAAGLGKALVCALVGAAVGTLFNRPLIRHPAAALLSTIAAVVVALASEVSPASAALRGNGAAIQSAAWPAGVPLLAAFGLALASWTVSCWLAGRRAD